MAYEFKLPDIGEGIHEGEIVQWLVKVGDRIQEDQPLVEVMTDKVTAEIPSPVTGLIQALHGNEGDVINVGAVIAVIETADAPSSATTVSSAPVAAPAASNAQASCTAVASPPARNGVHKVLAAPATRRLARQLGISLEQVTGSGPRGRITPIDVQQHAGQGGSSSRANLNVASAARSSTPGIYHSQGERREKFGGMRRKIAEHLVKSKQTAPHFAYVEEVDVTRLVALRDELREYAEAQGVKLNYLPLIMKAVVSGLRQFPMLNAQLDEQAQEIVYKQDCHLGVAVATDQGLIVPVVKHADQKDLLTLARDIADLAGKARSNKLSLDELKGGTFTLTSIGSIGGLFSVPIINYPEVGILGVNKIEKRPVVRTIQGQEQIVIRDVMYLSISCDHRVVDGAEAALFIKHVVGMLENPSRLLLEI